MKKVWIILGAVVLAVIIAAGSFYGGMAYQRNQVSQIQASFFASRGGVPRQGGRVSTPIMPSGVRLEAVLPGKLNLSKAVF